MKPMLVKSQQQSLEREKMKQQMKNDLDQLIHDREMQKLQEKLGISKEEISLNKGLVESMLNQPCFNNHNRSPAAEVDKDTPFKMLPIVSYKCTR